MGWGKRNRQRKIGGVRREIEEGKIRGRGVGEEKRWDRWVVREKQS